MARAEKIETGDRVRVDSTVTETHILEPSDSRLLFDGVRVLMRLLREAHDERGQPAWTSTIIVGRPSGRHLRPARNAVPSGAPRPTRKLLRLTRRTVGYVETAVPAVAAADTPWSRSWVKSAMAYLDLLGRVVAQTERRVLKGEKVPAGEKVVSLFEPHTDIIVKGSRGTHYGHKINLTTGHSGLALDVVVEDGNPADSARCLPMLERHLEHYGAPAIAGGLRRRLRFARESQGGQGAGHQACCVPQEVRDQGRGHDVLAVDVSATQAFPRWSRDGNLLPETLLWALAWGVASGTACRDSRHTFTRRCSPII